MISFPKVLLLRSRPRVSELRQGPGNRQTHHPGRPRLFQGLGAGIQRRPGGEYIIYQ